MAWHNDFGYVYYWCSIVFLVIAAIVVTTIANKLNNRQNVMLSRFSLSDDNENREDEKSRETRRNYIEQALPTKVIDNDMMKSYLYSRNFDRNTATG